MKQKQDELLAALGVTAARCSLSWGRCSNVRWPPRPVGSVRMDAAGWLTADGAKDATLCKISARQHDILGLKPLPFFHYELPPLVSSENIQTHRPIRGTPLLSDPGRSYSKDVFKRPNHTAVNCPRTQKRTASTLYLAPPRSLFALTIILYINFQDRLDSLTFSTSQDASAELTKKAQAATPFAE